MKNTGGCETGGNISKAREQVSEIRECISEMQSIEQETT